MCMYMYMYTYQGFIQDFSPGGGEGNGITIIACMGAWGHVPPGKFLILQPLRLLLVASETTSQFGLLLHIFTFFICQWLLLTIILL